MFLSSQKRRNMIKKRLSGQFAPDKAKAPANNTSTNPMYANNERANPLYSEDA